jgi:hypothetical protein
MVLLSIVWFVGLLTIIFHGTLFGFAVAPLFPVWAAIAAWIFVYLIIIRPLRWQSRMGCCGRVGQPLYYHHGGGFFGFIGALVFWAIVIGAIWHYSPASHQYFQITGDWIKNFVQNLHL